MWLGALGTWYRVRCVEKRMPIVGSSSWLGDWSWALDFVYGSPLKWYGQRLNTRETTHRHWGLALMETHLLLSERLYCISLYYDEAGFDRSSIIVAIAVGFWWTGIWWALRVFDVFKWVFCSYLFSRVVVRWGNRNRSNGHLCGLSGPWVNGP